METVILFFIIVILEGIKKYNFISYISIYGWLLVLLAVVYVIKTRKSLLDFYKDKRKADKVFYHENLRILLMCLLLPLYAYFIGFDGIRDFFTFMLIMILTLPRFNSSRRRRRKRGVII